MAITAGQVINYARDRHPALSEVNAPSQLAYREIEMLQEELVRDIVPRVPGFLAQILTVNFPLADFDAGVDLDTAIPTGWVDFGVDPRIQYNGNSPGPGCGWRDMEFVPYEQTDQHRPIPAITLRANTLFFLGSEQRYANATKAEIGYTAFAGAITDDDTVLILPNDALRPLSMLLAGYYLQRLVGSPSFNIKPDIAAKWLADGGKARAEFLTRIWRTTQRQKYEVNDRQPRV